MRKRRIKKKKKPLHKRWWIKIIIVSMGIVAIPGFAILKTKTDENDTSRN